jgi:signal transduction histidine kinase
MISPKLISMAARLLDPAGRPDAIAELRNCFGTTGFLIFIPDQQAGVLLPAPGFPQTLPRSKLWRSFLSQIVKSGQHTGEVNFPGSENIVSATGYAVGSSALVIQGENAQPAAIAEFSLLLPILEAGFRNERNAQVAISQAKIAQHSAAQARALAEELDGARSELQSAVRAQEQTALQLREASQELERLVQERTAELEAANLSLQELSARILRIQDEEHRRIARDLHDSAGQLIAALSMNLAYLKEKNADTGLVKSISDSQRLAEQMSGEIRTISHLLHPPLLDELGLASALDWYVREFSQRSKIKVDLNISPELKRLPQEMETSIFRIVQECLTNIHRHSGSTNAAISLTQDNSDVQIEVKDEGKGISPERQLELTSKGRAGVGFRGMRERARELGGRLEIRSEGSGTQVKATMPLKNLIANGVFYDAH